MDSILTIALHLAVIYSLIGILWILRLASLDFKNLSIACFVYFLCDIPTLAASNLTDYFELTKNLKWNWVGKTLTIVMYASIVFLLSKYYPPFRPAHAGFTLRQNKGSMLSAFILCGGIVLWLISVNHFSISDKRLETVLFQAAIPGFSEEPVFRGLILYFLTLGVKSGSFNLVKAPINWACFLTSLLFGLVHGLFVNKLHITFEPGMVLGTMITSFIFLWLRQVTGSLVLPIAMHNFLNLNIALSSTHL